MTAASGAERASAELGLLEDIVLRRAQPISSLAVQDPELNTAYEYWTSCRKDGLLPSRREIDVLQLKPVLGHTHLVDVTADDPADYRYRLWGSKVPLHRFRNYTNWRIGDYRSVPYRKGLMEDYSAVTWTGSPLYHQIVARLDSIRYSYARILLPLAEDGRKVNMLIVCTRDRIFPDFTV